MPYRAAKGLAYVFPIWFTQCGRDWSTLVMPCGCHPPTMSFFSRPRPQHVRRGTAFGLPPRIRLLPATTRSSTKVVIRSIPISDAGSQCETKQRFSWTRKRVVAAQHKKDDLLNCWTSSSDMQFGYIRLPCGLSRRTRHYRGTACYVWINGAAWQGHGMSTACYVWIGL